MDFIRMLPLYSESSKYFKFVEASLTYTVKDLKLYHSVDELFIYKPDFRFMWHAYISDLVLLNSEYYSLAYADFSKFLESGVVNRECYKSAYLKRFLNELETKSFDDAERYLCKTLCKSTDFFVFYDALFSAMVKAYSEVYLP